MTTQHNWEQHTRVGETTRESMRELTIVIWCTRLLMILYQDFRERASVDEIMKDLIKSTRKLKTAHES